MNNSFTRYKNHYNKDHVIKEVNEGIRELAAKEQVNLIDLHPHFLDEEKKLNKKYTEEGLHLNAEGYHVWANILQAYLK
ncbi:GDSL-type esterase/lipase family protein [Antarcticibacterium sp. 1MA-6-2]|uniref:GDSL-type esterase/lipase family protein n=1 Tax=Antarcticibacterium sp. 1MA-6-2 TaxID=2908210 RepID=UPI001F2CD72A|nr:GDSL-type esterase/lipase family protein [Antarcticibacterium sp. 1MA-6-2]UJH90615.1 GDSL-type esterase/lipase family protein [Antarcticibacterium sp. 1MA-6-2]